MVESQRAESVAHHSVWMDAIGRTRTGLVESSSTFVRFVRRDAPNHPASMAPGGKHEGG